jgi:hypothetical protein
MNVPPCSPVSYCLHLSQLEDGSIKPILSTRIYRLCFLSPNAGSCFPACNSSTAATAEGPALCRLTKSIDELADVVKTIINEDLATGVPVLAHIVRSVALFFRNPLAGFVTFGDVIKDVQTLGHVFNTSAEETKQILGDVSQIIDSTVNLISKIISSQ